MRLGRDSRAAEGSPEPRPTSSRPPPWLPRAVLVSTLIVVGVLLSLWVLNELGGLLLLLVVSFFVACAMEPSVNRLARRGWGRGRATGLVFSATAVAIGLFGWLMGQLLVDQVRDLVDGIPGFAAETARLIDEHVDIDVERSDVVADLVSTDGPLPGVGGALAGNVVGLGASLVGLLFQLLALVLFTYYLVVDGPRLRHWLCGYLSPARQRDLMRLADLAVDRTAAYFRYRGILAAISAVVHTVAFLALDLPSALALGIWVGLVSQFIPTVGTYVAALLPLLVAVGGGWSEVLSVLILIVIYQQIENYVISPQLSAATMDIHPAVGLAAAIGGTALFGPVGALLALPTVAIVQAFAGTYVHRREVIEPEKPVAGTDP